jgi:hypothetical protein
MAKNRQDKGEKFNLHQRLSHAIKTQMGAETRGDTKKVKEMEFRIQNIRAMMDDSYDYGKFSSGGLSTTKKYVNPVTFVDNLKNKK